MFVQFFTGEAGGEDGAVCPDLPLADDTGLIGSAFLDVGDAAAEYMMGYSI